MIQLPSDDHEWDHPFFKRLSSNDTGKNIKSHQGGVLIVKQLRKFLPELPEDVTKNAPTVDRRILADLVVNGQLLCTVSTRYQNQTRGAKRGPESRITGNLKTKFLEIAEEDDYLVFQRNLKDPHRYRLILVRKGSEDYADISEQYPKVRWGVIYRDKLPLENRDLAEARERQARSEEQPFELFDTDADIVTYRNTRVVRQVVFRDSLIDLYRGSCAVCGQGLATGNAFEVEGAHIVPRSNRGCDDARNGLALCRTHHWAFDNGLFGASPDYTIIVPEKTLKIQSNNLLAHFQGERLKQPSNPRLAPHSDALEWHRVNILDM